MANSNFTAHYIPDRTDKINTQKITPITKRVTCLPLNDFCSLTVKPV